MNKPGIAIVGCGYWGKNLVRNFAGLGALHSVCDSDVAIAREFADIYGVNYQSFDDIMVDDTIEGVAIATPAVSHAALAERALLAGKHVFVEKPVALDVEEALKVHGIAENNNRILMVGHLLQYHPAFRRLKDLVKNDHFGKLQHIYSHRLNFGKIRREENILWSFAPHDISMILALTGSEPIEIAATGRGYLHKAVRDITTTHMVFPDGEQAHIFVSWLHPFKEQKLVVVGELGMAVFDDTRDWHEKLCIYPHKVSWNNGIPEANTAEVEPVPLDRDEPLKIETKHFIDCILGRATCLTDGREAISVLRVLQASERAILENRTIKMNSEPNTDSGMNGDWYAHDSACIDDGTEIGSGTKIWHFSHIMSGSRIGKDCIIGQNVMIGPETRIGDSCKIQNNVSIYKGVTLKDKVFCGPSCVFTNVINPRAEINRRDEFKETLVNRGATVGANATILCGIEIGEYGFIAAGAVVTRDVLPYAVMMGVPAIQNGWMCRCGNRLEAHDERTGNLQCSDCSDTYSLTDGLLERTA